MATATAPTPASIGLTRPKTSLRPACGFPPTLSGGASWSASIARKPALSASSLRRFCSGWYLAPDFPKPFKVTVPLRPPRPVPRII